MEKFSEIVQNLQQTNFGEFSGWTNGKYTIEFFPEGFIALQKELSTGFHPELCRKLQQLENDADIRLAAVSLHCGIILDGTYTIAERDKLCFILAGRLEVLRQPPP